jgi:hypothetical protein
VTRPDAFAADAGPAPSVGAREAPDLRWWLIVVLLAVATVCALVWRTTEGVFSGVTTNPPSTFSAGTVSLADDDSGGALFAAAGLVPGDSASKCVAVTYTGSVQADVKLYTTAASYAGSLGDYLVLVVEQGTGGSFGGCGSFTPVAQLYAGTVAAFATAHTDFGTGVGSFGPSVAGATVTYRFTYTQIADNAAQGLASAIGFTWEARSV